MTILTTDNIEILKRPEVDSYISFNVGSVVTVEIEPTLDTLSVGSIPSASQPINSNSYHPISGLNLSMVIPSDKIEPLTEDLTIDDNIHEYLFFSTDSTVDKFSKEVIKEKQTPLFFSTSKDTDLIQATVSNLGTVLENADAKAIPQTINSWLNFKAYAIDNAHTLMKKLEVPPAITETMPGSLFDNKEVPFSGQAFIDHTLVIIDEDFTKILAKAAGTQGSFIKKLYVTGDKVHILAIPSNIADNIIPFRGVDITGVN